MLYFNENVRQKQTVSLKQPQNSQTNTELLNKNPTRNTRVIKGAPTLTESPFRC